MGKIDWPDMVNRVAKSVENALMRLIVKSIENAYNGQPNGKYFFNGTYDDGKLVEIIQNVEAKTGLKCTIFGNVAALANLRKAEIANWADIDKADYRNQGYVGTFYGTPVVQIPNFMSNEDELVLSQKHLFIIPAGTKIVKLLNEGNAEVHEVTDQHARMDNQIEYMFKMRYQLGVLRSSVYGVMQLV